jgi:hypothetical protein
MTTTLGIGPRIDLTRLKTGYTGLAEVMNAAGF